MKNWKQRHSDLREALIQVQSHMQDGDASLAAKVAREALAADKENEIRKCGAIIEEPVRCS